MRCSRPDCTAASSPRESETGGQVTVTFEGVPQLFLRRLYIQGMKQDTLAAQIQRATRLELGESFTTQELDQATEHLRQALDRNGFHEPRSR